VPCYRSRNNSHTLPGLSRAPEDVGMMGARNVLERFEHGSLITS